MSFLARINKLENDYKINGVELIDIETCNLLCVALDKGMPQNDLQRIYNEVLTQPKNSLFQSISYC